VIIASFRWLESAAIRWVAAFLIFSFREQFIEDKGATAEFWQHEIFDLIAQHN
jgi:hypothetical protein